MSKTPTIRFLCDRCWEVFQRGDLERCSRCERARPELGWETLPYTFLNRFVFIEVAGRGGMAVVFRAQSLQARPKQAQDIAVKVLPESGDPEVDQHNLALFQEEIAQASFFGANTLKGFVQVIGAESTPPAYLAMEYLPWITLKDLICSGPQPPVRVARISQALLGALAQMHAHQVLHCDLKPSNIFLKIDAQELQVKIADLGLARRMSGAGEGLSFGGTASYASPEQMEERPLDQRSDLHSLASISWRLLSHTLPWPEDPELNPKQSFEARREALKLGAPEAPQGMDPALHALLHRALSYDPKERFEDAKRMSAAFEEFIEDSTKSHEEEQQLRWKRLSPLEQRLSALQQSLKEQSALRRRALALEELLMRHRGEFNADFGDLKNLERDIENLEQDLKAAGLNSTAVEQPREGESRLMGLILGLLIGLALGYLLSPSSPQFIQEKPSDLQAEAQASDRVPVELVWEDGELIDQERDSALPVDVRSVQPLDAAPKVPKDPLHSSQLKSLRWSPVKGGIFRVGAEKGEKNERPSHEVTVAPFQLLRSEVTVAQYWACVHAGHCGAPKEKSGCNSKRQRRQPINCVDWYQAQAFCSWVGGRLPSEAEWERAARLHVRKGRLSCKHAVQSKGCGRGRSWPVCSKASKKAPFCDLAGNLWEWVQDWYGPYLNSARPLIDPYGPEEGSHKLLKGGSWMGGWWNLRPARRGRQPPETAHRGYGFRCAR